MPKSGSFGGILLHRPSIMPATRLICTLLVMWNSERSADRHLAPIPQNVLRHGTVRHGLEARPIEAGEQHPGITVAEIGFSPGRFGQPAQDRVRHAAGTVAAAGAPDRVIALVIGDLEKGLRPVASSPAKWPCDARHCGWKWISGVLSG